MRELHDYVTPFPFYFSPSCCSPSAHLPRNKRMCIPNYHWRKSRGMGGMYPPTFDGGGMACTNIPPLFEGKIFLKPQNVARNCSFLDCEMSKFSSSLAPLARNNCYITSLRLDIGACIVCRFIASFHK